MPRTVNVSSPAGSGLILFVSDLNGTPVSISKSNATEVQKVSNTQFRVSVPQQGRFFDFDLSVSTIIAGVDFVGSTADAATAALGLLFNNGGSGSGGTGTTLNFFESKIGTITNTSGIVVSGLSNGSTVITSVAMANKNVMVTIGGIRVYRTAIAGEQTFVKNLADNFITLSAPLSTDDLIDCLIF